MTVEEEIAKMQLQLVAANKSLKEANEMITAVATTLGKFGPPLEPPIVFTIYDHTIGSGMNQNTVFGTWTPFDKAGLPNNHGRYSNLNNNYIETRFYGYQAKVRGEKWENHGIIAVSVDGGSETTVDLYTASTSLLNEVLFDTGSLTEGEHTIKMRVTGTKNASASDYYYVHSAVEVYATELAPDPDPDDDEFDIYAALAADGGLVGNPGTKAQPVTLARAAVIATTGQRVAIRGGTYRETVTPTNNGVTYLAYPGETVIISGLDTADSGWTVHSGQIYKKTVTLPTATFTQTITSNTTIAANQVFKDGAMVIQARWPKANNVEAIFNRASSLRQRNSTSTWNGNTIIDSGIPNISGGWTGGKIFISGWYTAQTGNITSHSGTTIGYTGNDTGSGFCQYYYLTGRLGALTQANEFHYDSGTLYVWQPGGGSPTGIEYKTRNWGFNLAGKTGITIMGINFMACEIHGTTATASCVIDNNKFKYQNHTFLLEAPTGPKDKLDNSLYYNMQQTGLKMLGSNNIVRNSEFKYAACQGIIAGPNCLIENNKFEWIDYEGSYGCPVAPYIAAGGIKVLRNTFGDLGRSAVDFGWGIADPHNNMEIGYNDIYRFGWLSSDGGGTYGARGNQLDGTRVHHNWIHNSKSVHSPTSGAPQGINAGIYYDQATGSNTINDHNILWDNYQCDLHISTSGSEGNRGKAKFYNNTLCTHTYDGWVHGYWSYLNIGTVYYDEFYNNICRSHVIGGNWNEYDVNGETPMSPQNCIYRAVDPKFEGGTVYNPTNVPNPQTYFQLKSDSPGVNTGRNITGYTEGHVGVAPDIGAYERGATAWVPGFVPVSYNP